MNTTCCNLTAESGQTCAQGAEGGCTSDADCSGGDITACTPGTGQCFTDPVTCGGGVGCELGEVCDDATGLCVGGCRVSGNRCALDAQCCSGKCDAASTTCT